MLTNRGTGLWPVPPPHRPEAGATVKRVGDWAPSAGSETWGHFPRERKRLFKLIRDGGASGVVFLTGDRHLAEISRLPADHPDGVGSPLFDVCSSSPNTPTGDLTKTKVRFASEINSYRVGRTYFDVNFGTVMIDWEGADPVVRLQVRKESGQVVLQQRLTLGQLRARPKP